MVKLIYLTALALPVASVTAASIPKPDAQLPDPSSDGKVNGAKIPVEELLDPNSKWYKMLAGDALDQDALDPDSNWYKACMVEYDEEVSWFFKLGMILIGWTVRTARTDSKFIKFGDHWLLGAPDKIAQFRKEYCDAGAKQYMKEQQKKHAVSVEPQQAKESNENVNGKVPRILNGLRQRFGGIINRLGKGLNKMEMEKPMIGDFPAVRGFGFSRPWMRPI